MGLYNCIRIFVMEKNYIYFSHLIQSKNITSAFENNDAFEKRFMYNGQAGFKYKKTSPGDFKITEDSKVLADFEECNVYIFKNDYAFITSRYRYDFSQTSTKLIDEIICSYICPDGEELYEYSFFEVLGELKKKLGSNSEVTIISPGTEKTVFAKIELSDSYLDYMFEGFAENGVPTPYFLFSFNTNNCFDSDILQQLKTIAEVGCLDEEIQPELPLIRLNDGLSFIAGNSGIGLVDKEELEAAPDRIVRGYLRAIHESVVLETATEKNNLLLDKGIKEIKNLEELKSENLKQLRESVHLRNRIKNALKHHFIEDTFYNAYMESASVSQILDDYEETCNSVKDEIEVEMEKREKDRQSIFDRILSIIGVLALISAFKDGSDLNISLVEVLQNGSLKDIISLISVVSPILCLVLIVVIIFFIYRRK